MLIGFSGRTRVPPIPPTALAPIYASLDKSEILLVYYMCRTPITAMCIIPGGTCDAARQRLEKKMEISELGAEDQSFCGAVSAPAPAPR